MWEVESKYPPHFIRARGHTIFTVMCDFDGGLAEMLKRVGKPVKINGKVWLLTGWDDHRTSHSPSKHEIICISVIEYEQTEQ